MHRPPRHGPRLGSRRPEVSMGTQHLRSRGLPSAARHSIGQVGSRTSTYSWNSDYGFITPPTEPVRNPRLTVRIEYPDGPIEPVEVTFSLSPSYGIRTPSDAHGWFRRMMREHEGFEVETDRAGEAPLSFWSERVRSVMVE